MTGPVERYEAEDKEFLKKVRYFQFIPGWQLLRKILRCRESRYNSDGFQSFHCFSCQEHLGRRRGTRKVTQVKFFRAWGHLAQRPLIRPTPTRKTMFCVLSPIQACFFFLCFVFMPIVNLTELFLASCLVLERRIQEDKLLDRALFGMLLGYV